MSVWKMQASLGARKISIRKTETDEKSERLCGHQCVKTKEDVKEQV